MVYLTISSLKLSFHKFGSFPSIYSSNSESSIGFVNTVRNSANVQPKNGYVDPVNATAKIAKKITLFGLLNLITFMKSDFALSGFIYS
jgi:hypothetical protein